MKVKFFNLFIATTMLLGAVACTDGDNEGSSINSVSNDIESSQSDISIPDNYESNSSDENDTNVVPEKITSKIVSGSIFSDGLAIVNYYGDDNNTYCIDENGYVVFKSDRTWLYGLNTLSFKNGLVLINEYIYDKAGKITKPEDVDVTKFYDFALSNGHIFASVIESTFETSTKKLGVMNCSFEWLVSPSEELYNAFSKNADLWFYDTEYYNGSYYNQVQNNNDAYTYNCLNMNNSKVTTITTSKMKFDNSITFAELKEKYPTTYELTEFVNEKAAVLFYNSETNIYYTSMVDKGGNLLFNPIEVNCHYQLHTDGNILILSNCFGWDIISIDSQGKTLGTTTALNENMFNNDGRLMIDVHDNIVRIFNDYSKEIIYLNSELKPLFK